MAARLIVPKLGKQRRCPNDTLSLEIDAYSVEVNHTTQNLYNFDNAQTIRDGIC